MKESVTKFDFESAFKALDEIDIPVTDGIKANRPALTEIFSRKTKFDSLFEEYYDISSTEELGDAQEAREAEVAKAKLARIEKIVDLDADSPEDLLTSYVGKYIMQCPQCMTLFYKDKEDVVASEEDPLTVNVNEVCQHCGNESGYTLVGKVGEAEEEPAAEEDVPMDDLTVDEVPEETSEEDVEEATDFEDLNLDELDLDLDDEQTEEEVEESLTEHTGETLIEELADDKELDAKLEAHSEYIDYLRDAIAQEEQKLEKAKNEQVKVAIQRNIDTFKADLEAALPDAVKNETVEEPVIDEESVEEVTTTDEIVDGSEDIDAVVEALTEDLHEDTDLEVSADEFEKLINTPEFKKPISDASVRAMLDDDKVDDDSDEKEVEEALTEELLVEGNLLDLGKALFKKAKQAGGNFKNKISAAIDSLTKSATTREEKADWVLANALKDYANAKVSKKGVVPEEENCRFKTFLVIGFAGKDKKGKAFDTAPAHDYKGLVPKDMQEKGTYKDAEAAAKGWSMIDENGPAFIYLAESKDDSKAAFLCEFFDGKLEFDQLDNYFNTIKKNFEGIMLRAQGSATAEEEPATETTETTTTESVEVKTTLATIVEDIEELQEASLESQIAKSLAETCGNVDSFKLTDCSYLNEKLSVEGTITFKSGNSEATTFVFTEALSAEDALVSLVGCNEALGTKVTMSGRTIDKVFITESFK